MMVILLARHILFLAFLLSSLLALPLGRRDVVDPPILSPTATTVWYVGQSQTVTWNATGLPVNQTNPVGTLILGFWYNNSENLMLDSPLASNINYSVGQAQITVPNVPTGSNYIVVLFGDSGNASPEFTIVDGASSSTSVTPTSVTSLSLPASSPSSANQASPNGASIPSSTGVAGPSPLASVGNTELAASTTATAPSSPSTTPTVLTVTTSATPLPSQSSAAWRKHVPGLGASVSASLALIYFTFS